MRRFTLTLGVLLIGVSAAALAPEIEPDRLLAHIKFLSSDEMKGRSNGSPELDRASVKIEKVEVAADGKSVELTTAPLMKDRVYLLTAKVRSASGEDLMHPTGAYTLNEVPAK